MNTMGDKSAQTAFLQLRQYCEQEQFKGWDPYDGLNSRLFQAVPFLKKSALCRLAMIQLFKRNPVNLRPLFLVPKVYNAKGIALLLQAYCNAYRIDSDAATLAQIHHLADLLISLQTPGYSGACWGYSFDWQARRIFLFPKNTPTVVATCFAATALLDAGEVTGERRYIEVALSSAEFIVHDLHRTPCSDGFLFSYSPLQGNNTVYNASLLGSKLLALCYRHTRNEAYRSQARQSVQACCAAQRADGAWVYGMLPVQNWVDSFHTGYNLEALATYQDCTGDTDFADALERGLDYYLNHFFLPDGTPKYYDNKTYPIDIHCPAQLFVTLSRVHRFEDYREVARRVLDWTLAHMQSPRGYFYYQLKPGVSSKISYMRWSNAFMLYALSYYLLESQS